MPGILLYALATLVNYLMHRLGFETACQWFRQHVPRHVGAIFLLGLFGWLLPHVWRGYPKR